MRLAPAALAASGAPAPRPLRLQGRGQLSDQAGAASSGRTAEAERLRLAQFVAAMEASPGGVRLLDAGDQVEIVGATRAPESLRASTTLALTTARHHSQSLARHSWPTCRPAISTAGELPYKAARSRHAAGAFRRWRRPLIVLSRMQAERERAEAMRHDFVNVSHTRSARRSRCCRAFSRPCVTCQHQPKAERSGDLRRPTQQAKTHQAIDDRPLVLRRLERARPATGRRRWVENRAARARRGGGAGAFGGRHISQLRCRGRRRDRRCRATAKRARQPRRQRGSLHARRRPRSISAWRLCRQRQRRIAVVDSRREICVIVASPGSSIASTAAARRDPGSTGLGLAIVNASCSAMAAGSSTASGAKKSSCRQIARRDAHAASTTARKRQRAAAADDAVGAGAAIAAAGAAVIYR